MCDSSAFSKARIGILGNNGLQMNVPLVTPESGLVLEDTMMTPTRVVITHAVVEILEGRISKNEIYLWHRTHFHTVLIRKIHADSHSVNK